MIVGQSTGYPSLQLALSAQNAEQPPRFGHLGHSHGESGPAQVDAKTGKKKPKNPVGLVLWGLMDVTLMAGSVFFADMIVPDPHDHHHCQTNTPPTIQTPPTDKPVQTPEEIADRERSSWWKHAIELSGVATGLHLMSHVGLAGGWFLYGRSRGKHSEGEKLKDYAKVEKHLQGLAQDGGNFKVEPLGNGEFKVCRHEVPPTTANPKSDEKPSA